MLTIGTLLQDRYRIENVLGQGGMGEVYLATHVHLDREVAIKQLYARTSDNELDPGALRQCKHEALLLQSLSHPRLPAVFDYIEIDGCPYLIMEYVRGRSLGSILESGVKQSEGQVHRWGLALCEVLEYLHSRTPPIIFRDMKPSNVMLDVKGQIKLIDFGIAKLFDPSAITRTFAKSAGSPGYSAPEQYSGTTDVRSDMYSLGATLYALLAGKAPPPSVELAAGVADLTPLSVLRPDVRPQFAEAVHWCMQIRAMDRPHSVREAHMAFLATAPASPEAQPSPKGEEFATQDRKLVSPQSTTPLIEQRSNMTAPASLGPSETGRLPKTGKQMPPPPAPAPAVVAAADHEDAMDADDKPVLGRAQLVGIVGLLVAGMVGLGIYNMRSGGEQQGSPTLPKSPTQSASAVETPVPPPQQSTPSSPGEGANAYTNVTGADEGASFQYNTVREHIAGVRDYTLHYEYAGPRGNGRYGYRCVRPREVRTEILEGPGVGTVYVYNAAARSGEVLVKSGHQSTWKPLSSATPQMTFSILDEALRDVQNTTVRKNGTESVDGHDCIILAFSNDTVWDVDQVSYQIVRFKHAQESFTLSRMQMNNHPTINP